MGIGRETGASERGPVRQVVFPATGALGPHGPTGCTALLPFLLKENLGAEAKDREFKKQFYADTDALIESIKAGDQHQYKDRRLTSVTTGESRKREVSVFGQTH